MHSVLSKKGSSVNQLFINFKNLNDITNFSGIMPYDPNKYIMSQQQTGLKSP
jgi:hypothetical protein